MFNCIPTTGPLLYAANHGNELFVQWWDAVDIIGVDAYYPLAITNSAPSKSSVWNRATAAHLFAFHILLGKISDALRCMEVRNNACSPMTGGDLHQMQ